MYYWIIPLSLGVVFLILFLIERVKENRLIALIFKGLTSLMFILTGLLAWIFADKHNYFGLFVTIGLVFGLFGDIFLDIKFMSEKHDTLFTRLGFISFGIGHLFFITGLISTFTKENIIINQPIYIIVPAALSLVFTLLALLLEKFTNIKYGNMKAFAIGYGLVLFFVMNLYWGYVAFLKFKVLTLILMAVGFILFTLSDMILNNTYFAKGCNTPKYIISNHICYYAAQFLIAASLFFI